MPEESIARTGFGIDITFASGFLAEIVDVNPPGSTREAIDTSFTKQLSKARLKMMQDLYENQNLSVTIHFDPKAVPPIDGAFEEVTLTFGDGTTWKFQGAMQNYQPAAPMDDKMTAECELAISGEITITPSNGTTTTTAGE